MRQTMATGRQARRLAPLAIAIVLVACGGGGGGGAATTPLPESVSGSGGDSGGGNGGAGAGAGSSAGAGAATLDYAECSALPGGVTNHYLNIARPRHAWRSATFLGQAVIGRFEYAAGATQAERARYFKADAASGTIATLGEEWFTSTGAVAVRIRYVGLALPSRLAVGESRSVDYQKHWDLPAAPTQSQRVTVTYEGNDQATLVDGRVDTCRVSHVTAAVEGGAATEISRERLHLAKGAGVVKRYATAVPSGGGDGPTELQELLTTTASLTPASATAGAAPSLLACAQMPPASRLVFTASSPPEADSALRSVGAGSFGGMASIATVRRRLPGGALTSVRHFDPALGILRWLGIEQFADDGTLAQQVIYGERPDLSATAVGETVSYAQSARFLPADHTMSSVDRFTFVGHERVTTPLGTFDTCKVRFDLGSGQETYFLAPGLHWVRLDTAFPDGSRTTRELVSR